LNPGITRKRVIHHNHIGSILENLGQFNN
jgi:hypothetical protein